MGAASVAVALRRRGSRRRLARALQGLQEIADGLGLHGDLLGEVHAETAFDAGQKLHPPETVEPHVPIERARERQAGAPDRPLPQLFCKLLDDRDQGLAFAG